MAGVDVARFTNSVDLFSACAHLHMMFKLDVILEVPKLRIWILERLFLMWDSLSPETYPNVTKNTPSFTGRGSPLN